MKDILTRRPQLKAANDPDKNESQIAPPAEDDTGLARESLLQHTTRPRLQRNAPPAMRF